MYGGSNSMGSDTGRQFFDEYSGSRDRGRQPLFIPLVFYFRQPGALLLSMSFSGLSVQTPCPKKWTALQHGTICRCGPSPQSLSTWHCSFFRNSFSRFNGRCMGEERLDVTGIGQLTGNFDFPLLANREVAWAIRVILLSLSALLSASGTLACILFKIWRHTIRSSQSLGIWLLLGIITMHLSAFFFTAENANDPFLCLLRIALPAMAHAICFGVVVVKAVQLRNAEFLSSSPTGEVGQQISYWNYWLLFFIVTVQTAMFRELGKTLCGLHRIGNQLSALQEGNAPDGGGPTKSDAARQSETEDI